ncbi:hypothetical protein EV182_006779, partial [Spiromyces aspiralis]
SSIYSSHSPLPATHDAPQKLRTVAQKRKTPSPEHGWENMEIEAYTPPSNRTKRQIATGAHLSKSGAQAGPNTHTHRSRTGHSYAITERSGTTKEWADEHERKAKALVSEGCIRQDIDKVLDLLHPRNQAVAVHASRIAAAIAGQLDSLSLSSSEKGVKDILPWIALPSPHEAETTMTKNRAKNKGKEGEKPEATEFEAEHPMYPCIIMFINFVAKKVQGSSPMANRHNHNSSPPPPSLPSSPPPSPSSSPPTPTPTPPRLIYACKNTDVKPKGSDGGTQIDIELVEVSLDATLANVAKSPSYYELFAVIEAKRS